MTFKGILIYYVLINSISGIIFITDKIKAQKGKWRVSEKCLWFFSAIGGALFPSIIMYIIHHKTRHKLFTVMLPMLSLLQILLLILSAKIL